MKYIVAGDYRQCVRYCREHGLNPIRDVVYVRDVSMLRGTRRPEIVFYGTWAWRKDLRELQSVLAVRDATVAYA